MHYIYSVIRFQKAIITSKFSVWLISNHGTIYFTPSFFAILVNYPHITWCLADLCVPQCSSSISSVFSFLSPVLSGVMDWIWIFLLDLTDFWFWLLFALQPMNCASKKIIQVLNPGPLANVLSTTLRICLVPKAWLKTKFFHFCSYSSTLRFT